jgi:DNA modification methylase
MIADILLPQTIEHVPVEQLVPYARNARTHSDAQVDQIAAAIREFGWTNPVLIDAAGGIIAGHGRVLAALKLGIALTPCIRLTHLSDAQRRALILADNKLALNAGWDEQLLAEELLALSEEGFDLDITGFAEKEIDALFLAAENPPAGNVDEDETPAVTERAVIRAGEIWMMGEHGHRLMCGDATLKKSVRQLLGEKIKVDCVWTDPPYNVAYGDKAAMLNEYGKGHRITSRILNDDMDDKQFADLLGRFYAATFSAMKPGAAIYVAHSETERANFTTIFLSAGFKLSGVVVWRKDSLVLGRSDYQWMHEPILYGWKPGAAHNWRGGRKQTTVAELGPVTPFARLPDGRWQVTVGHQMFIVEGSAAVEEIEPSILREARPRRNDLHPTMKPVELIRRMLRNSARPGQVVYDGFGGSGSTLIACEQLALSARLMELSPNYCDVIVRRWQQYVGGGAILEGDGRSFNEIEIERRGHD